MQKKYNVAIDLLRIIAILAVILIHTTIKTIQLYKHDIDIIPFTFFLNQIGIFAVPLFFLISGFLLELHYKNLDYLSYFKKRASRIVIPYFFWSLFYYVGYPAIIPANMSFPMILLLGKASYQLYFIPAIILFYSVFPFLHMIYRFLAKKLVITMLIVIELFLLTRDYFYGPFSFGNALRVTLLAFVFFPLGMIASHHEARIISFVNKYMRSLIVSLIGMMILVCGFSWFYYFFTHRPQAIYSQYQPLVLPYTLLFASIVFTYFSTHDRFKNIIARLSKLSFFVFFIHVAIIYTFWEPVIEPVFAMTRFNTFAQIGFDVFFFGFVTITSFLIADIIHRLPYVSKITG